MSETARLAIEFYSKGLDQVRRDAKSFSESTVAAVEVATAKIKMLQSAALSEIKTGLSAQNAATKTQLNTDLANTRIALAERLSAIKIASLKEVSIVKDAEREKNAARSNKGFKVVVGAIAGQGFSVGGIASINPYAAAAVAGAYAVKNVTESLVREATVWEKFKVALTDIEGSAAKAKETTGDLYELAKRPGIGLKEAEQTYIQFRALNMEGEKAQRVIKAVSNAVALSGNGAVEFGRINLQITQMLSKGKVLEEDLRIMRNSMPRLTAAMREAFGTTTAEGIRKLGVNSEQFLDKIVSQFEKLPQASQTLESAFENAATASSRFKASLANTDYVKDQLTGWTSLLESMTRVVEGESIKWSQLLADVFIQGPWSARDNFAAGSYLTSQEEAISDQISAKIKRRDEIANMSDAYYNVQKALNNIGASKDQVDASLSMTREQELSALRHDIGAYSKRGNKAAEYNATQKAIADYNNSKSKATDPPAADKEAKARSDAAAREKERELATLRQIALENERLRITLSANTEFDKERLILVADYANKIGVAKTTAEKVALTEQRDLQLSILHVKNRTELEREQANVVEDRAAIAKKALEELAAIQKKQDEDRKAANQAKIDSGNSLSFQFAPEGEKLKIEYERNQTIANEALYKSVEDRNRVIKALNDQYVRDQAEMYTQVATTVTSAGQSMFGDFASSYKMGIDYRYNLEKAGIEKTLSLTGLEGKARIDQQRKRDDALQSLDEKRQSQMEGTYLTMFMIAKGFALAESVLKLNLAIVQAAASGPFPANLAAMATVAASVGAVVSNIASINYAGAYDKGGDIPSGSWGIAGENGPEVIQGPAHVTSTKATAALLGGNRAPTVNVMNYSGQNVQVREGSSPGDLEIIVGQVAKRVEDQLSTGVRSGRGQLAGAMKETFGLNRSGTY